MSKTTIQVLHIVVNAGKSKKTGNDYDMRFAQCIVHQKDKETGAVVPLIGELLLPKEYQDVKPGTYEVDFKLAISQDKRIMSVVDTMTDVKTGKDAKPVEGADANAKKAA